METYDKVVAKVCVKRNKQTIVEDAITARALDKFPADEECL